MAFPDKLVAPVNPDLKAWKIGRNELNAGAPKYYSDTAKWAAAIHLRFPEADGLVQIANQCDPELARLFFGDFVAQTDFGVESGRGEKVDSSFLANVRNTGQRAAITITLQGNN